MTSFSIPHEEFRFFEIAEDDFYKDEPRAVVLVLRKDDDGSVVGDVMGNVRDPDLDEMLRHAPALLPIKQAVWVAREMSLSEDEGFVDVIDTEKLWTDDLGYLNKLPPT